MPCAANAADHGAAHRLGVLNLSPGEISWDPAPEIEQPSAPADIAARFTSMNPGYERQAVAAR